jgi:type VI secretion system secreted protein Hcp
MKAQCLKNISIAAAVAITLFCPISAIAAVDMFLKLDGIKGESTDNDHRDEIDVLAWSWGESSGTARIRRGAVPPACIQDVAITKYIDKSSPLLIMHTVQGTVIPEAKLTMRAGGGSSLEFLVIRMTNVMITSYSTGGSGSEDRLTENITIRSERMVGEYQPQNAKGVKDGPPVVWDISGQSSRGCH